MSFSSIAYKSAALVLSSVVFLSACGKKHDDKKIIIPGQLIPPATDMSQPYQKDNQILSNLKKGVEGSHISCKAEKTFVVMSLTDHGSFEGTYHEGIVQFSKFVEHDSQGQAKSSELNAAGIKQLCDEYTYEKNGFAPGEITYALTSCKDDSGKEYTISITSVTGDALWCNKK